MGSGKDAFGEILVKLLESAGYETKILKYASGVKEIATKYFGWKGDKFLDRPDTGVTCVGGRSLLQGIGHSFREEVGPDFWIKLLRKQLIDPKVIYIITDERYLREVMHSKNMQGCTVKIIREGFGGDGHPSETELDTPEFQEFVDHVIRNQGSLEDLRTKAASLLRKLGYSS